MFCTRQVTNDIFWIGADDRRLSLFEGVYAVPRGVSYNAYLVRDEKTVLFDTVDSAVGDRFFENLAHALDGRALDYVVVQHMEPDHSATLGRLLEKFPAATVVCNQKTAGMIRQFFGADVTPRALLVKEGDTLSTGRHTFSFVMAPMVHWPEVMVTYDAADKILFSADAFGTFGALNGVIAGYTTIPPFIITLATMNIAKSVALILNSGTLSISVPILKTLNDLQIGFVPFPAILAILLYLFFFWVLKKRRYGTALYAVGGKEEAALTAGINVQWTKTSVYLISGTLAGLAGVVYAVRLNSANPTAAAGLELDAICSVVLGGTALTGGQGSIWGAYLGAIAIYMLRNGMNMFGIRIIEQMTVIGLVLILILAFDVFNRRKGAVKK